MVPDRSMTSGYPGCADGSGGEGLRKKACELEEEVKSLKEENAKQVRVVSCF